MDAKVNHFVSQVGGCGPFQLWLGLCVYCGKGVGAWSMMLMTFAVYNPGWICEDLQSDTADSGPGSSVLTNLTGLGSTENNNTDDERCRIARSCPSDLKYDSESSTIISEWSLICDRDWIPPLIISIQMIGLVIGSFLCGYFSERLGRKVSLYTWVALSAVFNLAAGLSSSWQMFTVFRFFVGVSIGGNLSVSQMYALEFVTSKWRARVPGLPTWNISNLLLACCLVAFKDWRNVHFATAVASFAVLLTVFWVPESLRWQVVHGKTELAQKTARRICKHNKKPPPSEEDIDFSVSVGKDADQKTTVLDLFKKPLRKRTILIAILYALLAPMYYGIGFGVKALDGNFYLNFAIFALLPIPAAPSVWLLSNKFGRRWATFVFLAAASVLSFVILIIVFTVESSSKSGVITAIALCVSCCTDLAFSVAITFIAELYPTSVRATGFSFAFTVARLSSILAPYLIPKNPDLLYVAFILLGTMSFITSLVVLALPETMGKCLQELVREETVNGVMEEEVEKQKVDLSKTQSTTLPLMENSKV